MTMTKNPDGSVTMPAEAAERLVDAAKKHRAPKPEAYYTDADIPENPREMSDSDLERWLSKMDRQRREWNET